MTALINKKRGSSIEGLSEFTHLIGELYGYTEKDGIQKRLCHNDCYDCNFLKDREKMYLIEWKYSGNADPAGDLGALICCSDYTFDKAMDFLKIYFERPLTGRETCHYLAYIAIHAYYWYIWALYKECVGEIISEYLYIWYRYAKDFGKTAMEYYILGLAAREYIDITTDRIYTAII